jgi:cytochrome c-type biogenesis protein CcmH/NrfG
MRVLFATGIPPGFMLAPRLAAEQVICGPDWSDARDAAGRVLSLSTPPGEYDLAAVAARLPADQAPDVVVCLVDSSRRSLPRNLRAFGCPRVLLLANTHHLNHPLSASLRYLDGETFDRVVLLHDRHHAAFLAGAGVRNLHWFPGLTFAHDDETVKAARCGGRAPRIACVGRSGRRHPRRSRLLDTLGEHGLRVAQEMLAPTAALSFYGSALVGFNTSRNGELNLRVFEVLAAGAALLTDRLAPEAGVGGLLSDLREFASYGSLEELVERAAHLVANPDEAFAIGTAGAAWFDRHLNQGRRWSAFAALAHDNVSLPEFELPRFPRVFFGGDAALLRRAIIVYEGVQDLHRGREAVRVTLDAGSPGDFAGMCATLPRVSVVRGAEDAADLGVVSLGAAPDYRGAQNLWCWDAPAAEIEPLARQLEREGFALASPEAALFGRTVAAAIDRPAPSVAALGRALFLKGDLNGALEHAQAALKKDGRCVPALVLFGELALAREGAALAEKLFRQALLLQPWDLSIESLIGEALSAQKKFPAAADCFVRVLRSRPNDLRSLLALARLRVKEGHLEAAEAALRDAVKSHPGSAEAALELGNCLKLQEATPIGAGQ